MVAIIYMYDVPPHWDEKTIGLLLNKTTTTTTTNDSLSSLLSVHNNNNIDDDSMMSCLDDSQQSWLNVIRIRRDVPPLCKELAQMKLIFPNSNELVSCISKFQSLAIPMTHGYHYFSFSYNETIYEPFQHPPSTYLQDVPLHLQLMALSSKELQSRIDKHTKQNKESSKHTNQNKKRKRGGYRCKVTHHANLAKQLGILMGEGFRNVIHVQGIKIQNQFTDPLLQYLQNNTATLWPTKDKQRKGVHSSHYLTVRQKHPKEHDGIWNLCHKLIESIQPQHYKESSTTTTTMTTTASVNKIKYTALAITKNFRGSPHIDFHDTTYQHVIALGSFTGGRLCVESDEDEVVSIDIQNRLGRMDGRRVHWVTGFQGERYSVVYYSTDPNHFTPPIHQSNHNQWIQSQNFTNMIK